MILTDGWVASLVMVTRSVEEQAVQDTVRDALLKVQGATAQANQELHAVSHARSRQPPKAPKLPSMSESVHLKKIDSVSNMVLHDKPQGGAPAGNQRPQNRQGHSPAQVHPGAAAAARSRAELRPVAAYKVMRP